MKNYTLLLGIILLATMAVSLGTRLAKGVDGEGQAVAEKIELLPPKGYELYGGADLESRVDGAGRIFVAATGETERGFGGLMWMQSPDGQGGWKSTPIDLGGLYPSGRGSLSVESDGQLYLTQWGEKSQAWRLRIAGWKPHRN